MQLLDELLAPNYKRYLTATAAPLDAAAQKQRLGGMRTVFPDLNITIDDMIAEGDRVALRMTIRGTQKVAYQGIPPSGKQVTVSGVEVVRVENGKFVEHWGGADNLDLAQQLGGVVSAAPPPMTPFPAGTFARAPFTWEFKTDGSFEAHLPKVVTGTYTVAGNQIVVKDKDDVCGDVKGTYTWTFDGKALSFKTLDDQCFTRQDIVDRGAWTKQ